MRTYLWPGDHGWPATEPDPDVDHEAGLLEWVDDPAAELDEDVLAIHAPPPHLWDDLDPLERRVLAARFGLDGTGAHTLAQLHDELGVSRRRARRALDSGLAKLRARLASDA